MVKLALKTSDKKERQEKARKKKNRARKREIILDPLRLPSCFYFDFCSRSFFLAVSYSSLVIAPFL
jgi:hypothetical protein